MSLRRVPRSEFPRIPPARHAMAVAASVISRQRVPRSVTGQYPFPVEQGRTDISSQGVPERSARRTDVLDLQRGGTPIARLSLGRGS